MTAAEKKGNSSYVNHGYNSRQHYLECLAEDYGYDKALVFELASILGANEDFDGLIIELEDNQNKFSEMEE